MLPFVAARRWRWAAATSSLAQGTGAAVVVWARLVVSRTTCSATIGAAAAFALAGAQAQAPSLCAGHKKRSRAEAAASDDQSIFEVERIVARRLVKGAVEYLIKWQDYSEEQNTWEPLANLAGIEQDLSEFEARQAKEIADYNEEIRKKQSRSQAQMRLVPGPPGAAAGGARGSAPQPASAQPAPTSTSTTADVPSQLTGKKKAPIWQRFLPSKEDKDTYICQEIVDSRLGKICGTCIVGKSGPTPLWSHHKAKHSRMYQELQGYLDPEQADPGMSIQDALQKTLKAAAFSKERKDECDMACARWLVKSARPLTMPERDEPLREFIAKITRGAYTMPNHLNIADKILRMSATGVPGLLPYP